MFPSDSNSLERHFFRLTALDIVANVTAPLAGLTGFMLARAATLELARRHLPAFADAGAVR